MNKLIFVLALLLPTATQAQRSPYVGIYANAAGDDGVSDTLYGEMEISDSTFSLRFVTREELRASGKTGQVHWMQYYGSWETAAAAKTLDITYYRRGERPGEKPMENVEHYTADDGRMVLLHFKGGRTVRGIFTAKHYPDLAPMLCLQWSGSENLVFANWSRDRRKGKG